MQSILYFHQTVFFFFFSSVKPQSNSEEHQGSKDLV